MVESVEVVIIGAGPSGAIAAALLHQKGHDVVVVEQSTFPRFSIGESLLPYCMKFIEEAGMGKAVTAAGFQLKNGAAFAGNGKYGSFDFSEKFSPGPSTTFQVQRGAFDQILAETAISQGADIRFGQKIIAISTNPEGKSTLTMQDHSGVECKLQADFVLDASGFGRVLPNFFGLDKPSDFPSRRSVFTHVEDNITDAHYDREKVLIVIHPEHCDVWYWLIPFSNGRCSLGVVAESTYFEALGLEENSDLLKAAVAASPELSSLLQYANYDTEVRNITGYASDVTSLWGKGYALLGNAGEFLDPIFSSGVTIAMKSASLAAPLVSRHLKGELVDWQLEYSNPLKQGVDTFRAFVDGWYRGDFQQVVFAKNQSPAIREMICSILAGYAWDTDNPFVLEPQRRLRALTEICATV